MVTIKRYSNRKMYNTDSKSYVTLDEISELVQAGIEIKVIDHLTRTDITAAIMTQVLAKQEKNTGGMIPKALLERMVQLSGLTLYSMRESMKAFLDPVVYMQDDITRRLDSLLRQRKLDSQTVDQLKTLLLDPELDPVLIKDEEEQPAATVQEVQRLLDQIEALEKEFSELEKQKKKLG